MGSYSPMSLYDEDPESRFLDLFNRFQTQVPQYGEYLKPDDPGIQEYQRLSGEPTGSEDLISSYISSRPEREEFNPSFKQKMLATLIGSLAGGGDPTKAYGLARSHIERPYTEALSDWKLEGSNIATRARLMDSERSRKLNALKYDIQQRGATNRAMSVDERARMQEARRLADEVANEEQRNQDQKDREAQRTFQRTMAGEIFNLRKDMFENTKAHQAEVNTRIEEENKRQEQARLDKKNSLDEVNKRILAHASQQGIPDTVYDEEGNKRELTVGEVARILAMKKAKSSPAFADLIEGDEAGGFGITEGGGMFDTSGGDSRRRILNLYLQKLRDKYLRGEF